MRTLYLRNVPDELAERLERLAARDGMSVNAVAIRELEEGTRYVNNAELLAGLPDFGLNLSGADIVAEVEAGRAERDRELDDRR